MEPLQGLRSETSRSKPIAHASAAQPSAEPIRVPVWPAEPLWRWAQLISTEYVRWSPFALPSRAARYPREPDGRRRRASIASPTTPRRPSGCTRPAPARPWASTAQHATATERPPFGLLWPRPRRAPSRPRRPWWLWTSRPPPADGASREIRKLEQAWEHHRRRDHRVVHHGPWPATGSVWAPAS